MPLTSAFPSFLLHPSLAIGLGPIRHVTETNDKMERLHLEMAWKLWYAIAPSDPSLLLHHFAFMIPYSIALTSSLKFRPNSAGYD